MIEFFQLVAEAREILEFLGTLVLCFIGFILLNFIAIIQVTWNMTEEEKAAFHKHIQENGIYSDPDDFF